MTKQNWCRIIEMSNGAQVLLVKQYDDEESEESPFAVKVTAEYEGVRATFSLYFAEEKGRDEAFVNYDEEHAQKLFDSLVSMATG